ncbi:MAG TPA: hypothetical protein VGM50_00250, partial [Gemmatimonadaceae bacterium]
MTAFFDRIAIVALLASVALTGCTGDAADAKTGTSTVTAKRRVTKASAGSIDLGAASYKPATGSFGSPSVVSGTIRLDGAITPDAYKVTKDQAVCGTTASGAVSQPGKTGGFGSTVVWIADVKTGKQFPMDKRQELSSEKCVLAPRVQAAVVGTTFNVFNDDKLLHRLVFLDTETRDTLTVMPFFNAGQVVATEKLAKKSGIIEVRCVQHPWTRAYIVVFDHP